MIESVIPVIIAGGSGSRLWPLSRASCPKPFIKLADGHSLLQKSFIRAIKIPDVQEVMTVTNQELFFHTQSEYHALDTSTKKSYILEPMGRGTAPAIAAAALQLAKSFHENSILCIIPADHIIQDEDTFMMAVKQAIALAKRNCLVTLGIKPDSPETGYGYLEIDTDKFSPELVDRVNVDSTQRSYYVRRFVEKPSLEMAQHYFNSGQHLWNSGIFLFSIRTILHEMQQTAPDILSAVKKCLAISEEQHKTHHSYIKLNSESFALVPENSIDYCVMEKSSSLATVVSDFGWKDIGSWNSMSELTEPDNEGNRMLGNGWLHNTANCYIHGSHRLIGAVGVENLAIIDTPDALLVLNRNHTQSVKQLVQGMKQQDNEIIKFHSEVHRPWGFYKVIGAGKGFKVKLITIKPGASLSLQLHQHRSEHWIVISGNALVVKDDRQFTLAANESAYILPREKHRLKNPGAEDLVVVEVQCGENLDEDDIIRYEDDYERTS